jgi:hypothetical protein
MERRTTYWFYGPYTEVRPEDRSLRIKASNDKEDVEVLIESSLFPAIRAAMDAAEG